MRTTILLTCLLVGCGSDDASAPAAPSNLAVTNVAGGGHLTWTDNSGDEDEFVILRGTVSGSLTEIDAVTFNGVQYHDAAVTVGTTYYYQVVAVNAGGESPSNEAMFTP